MAVIPVGLVPIGIEIYRCIPAYIYILVICIIVLIINIGSLVLIFIIIIDVFLLIQIFFIVISVSLVGRRTHLSITSC